MSKRVIAALLPLVILILIPIWLRPSGGSKETDNGDSYSDTEEVLVIVSPHTEPIKYEFEHAFREYYRKRNGRDIRFDWRNVGGTSDIVRYINDRYEAAFRQEWESRGNPWNELVIASFRNGKLDLESGWKNREAKEIRQAFLESEVGIGIDLFFGGGTYDMSRFAAMGYGVDAKLEKKHPDWFASDVLPKQFAGEQLYDKGGRYYSLCLSTFGIAYNQSRLEENRRIPKMETWADLANPACFQAIAIADPTKSGSITKCFEMILQQAIAEEVSRIGNDGIAAGWEKGFLRIKLIAANSRYATDSAGKLVRDISSGAVAAGMCIDFYGLSEAQWNAENSGNPRIAYVMPKNGTALSGDPIQLLRGAPNPAAARAFIEFALSPAGQKLWMLKPGTPGGPRKYALRRPGVRMDLYRDKGLRAYMSDPDYDPYQQMGTFAYHGNWTGRYFNLIRILVRTLALDPMDDLREAWQSILENGGPEANPEAMRHLAAMPFSYQEAGKMSSGLQVSEKNTAVDVASLRRGWSDFASAHYREAKRLARGKGKAGGKP